MLWRRLQYAALPCLACFHLVAQTTTPPKDTSVPNTIRVWGDTAAAGALDALETGFRRAHPQFTFKNSLYGSGAGMAGIITGTSEIALMGRPATANEIMGFEWVHRYKPLAIEVMTGSERTDGRSPALAVVVNRTNPVRRITLQQLRQILACPESLARPVIRDWGELPGASAWSGNPIHAYLYDNETGTGAFLQAAILGSGDKWNWSRVREFRDRKLRDGTVQPAAQQIARALADDPGGIAFLPLSAVTPEFRTLSVAKQDSGTYFPLTRDTLIRRQYPLTRSVYVYLNRAPGRAMNMSVRAFVDYVLSPEGQQTIVAEGDFLPLSPADAQLQRARLQ